MPKFQWRSYSVAVALTLAGCTGTSTVGLMPCSSTSNCDATQFCIAGACYPKVSAGACDDTAEHSAGDVCVGGVCLAGACCASACATADPVCKATGCDATTGACQYPSSTVGCGSPASCVSGTYTAASTCNGKGTCASAQAIVCDAGVCADSQTCAVSCTNNSSCSASQFCSSGICVSKDTAGATCGAGSDCTSGACLGSRCCVSTCDTTDPQCGAAACDATGACIYPTDGLSCGAAQACLGTVFTPTSFCNGDGACAPSPSQSCEPYTCDQLGRTCYATCTLGGTQCATDGYCGSATCALKGAPGTPCAATSTSDADQSCLSSICEVNCCVNDCPSDPTTNNCGGTCNDAGSCVATICPNHFGCSGSITCNTQCASDKDCDTQSFCDLTGVTACCAKLGAGDALYVDAVLGDDTVVCCGSKTTPCQTLTRAMALVAGGATSGVILQAMNGDGGTSWTENETYPIHLGWGVTLNAPSLYFANPNNASKLFEVYAYDPTDNGTVAIQGGPVGIATDPVRIGFDPNTSNWQNSLIAVDDEAVEDRTALPLVLSNVWMVGSFVAPNSTALNVGAGAAVTLGPQLVYVGDGNLFLPDYPYNGILGGFGGITCTGAGASIQDDPAGVAPVLAVSSTSSTYLEVDDGCTVALTQGPILGNADVYPVGWDGNSSSCPPTSVCLQYCDAYPSAAVSVVGGGSVSIGSALNPASIICAFIGVDEETSDATGSPSASLTNAVVDLQRNDDCFQGGDSCSADGQACAGAIVTEGSFSATATTFRHTYLGVFVAGNATKVDLSGGGGGGNTFECYGSQWSSEFPGTGGSFCPNPGVVPPNGGVGVVNASGTIGVDVETGVWNDYDTTANTTQVWTCSDTTYTSCTCAGPNCSDAGPVDGADAIYLSTNTAAAPLDSAGGSQNTSTTCEP